VSKLHVRTSLKGAFRRLVKRPPTVPTNIGEGPKVSSGEADVNTSAAGPAEEIRPAKGSDPNPTTDPEPDDGDDVLFLCCYFARTKPRKH